MWSLKRTPIRRLPAGGVYASLGMAGVLGAVVAFAASCSRDSTSAPPHLATEVGSPVALGAGTAHAYLVLDGSAPTELGVALSGAALDSLPSAAKMGGYEYLIPLPANNPTQYQVIGLNWNPTGHPPPMVYTVPHFDVHFYMTSLDARNAIDPSDPVFGTKAANLPGVDLRPANYVADPPANAIPHMGLHWTDTTAGEFHGQPFTRTFIVGSWNGQFTFVEPMVTRAYLLSHPNDLVAVPGLTQLVTAGYHPTQYRVSWDAAAAEWHVAIAGLQR